MNKTAPDTANWFADNPAKARLLTLLLAAIFVEGVLQLAVALFMATPPFSPPFKYLELPKGADPRGLNVLTHHDAIPNTTFVRYPSRADSFLPATTHINSFGIRGPEIHDKKLPRVLIVGDSFVEATAIPFEKTAPQLLNAEFGNKREFLSHGVGGWSPTTEFSWLYHKGVTLNPDEVWLVLFVNDFFLSQADDMSDQTYRREAVWQNGIPVRYDIQTMPTLRQKVVGLLKRVQLISIGYYGTMNALARFRLNALAYFTTSGQHEALTAEYILLERPREQWPEELQANVTATIDVIRAMASYLAGKSIRLKVVMLPSGFAWPNEVVAGKRAYGYGWAPDFTVSQTGLENEVSQGLRKSNIAFYNSREYFDRAKVQDVHRLLYNEADGHLNIEGHLVLFEFLRDKVY